MIDEELLKPSREGLARIAAMIAANEAEARRDIERYGYGDKEYVGQRWREHHMTIAPLLREQEALGKVITDYYALQPLPPAIISRNPSC